MSEGEAIFCFDGVAAVARLNVVEFIACNRLLTRLYLVTQRILKDNISSEDLRYLQFAARPGWAGWKGDADVVLTVTVTKVVFDEVVVAGWLVIGIMLVKDVVLGVVVGPVPITQYEFPVISAGQLTPVFRVVKLASVIPQFADRLEHVSPALATTR